MLLILSAESVSNGMMSSYISINFYDLRRVQDEMEIFDAVEASVLREASGTGYSYVFSQYKHHLYRPRTWLSHVPRCEFDKDEPVTYKFLTSGKFITHQLNSKKWNTMYGEIITTVCCRRHLSSEQEPSKSTLDCLQLRPVLRIVDANE